jgi:hypothetical protein
LRKEWDFGKINLANHLHYGDWRDATRSCLPSQSVPIYNVSMEEARWEAVCPGTFLPVLMIRINCSPFRAKAAQFSGHLPVLTNLSLTKNGKLSLLMSE